MKNKKTGFLFLLTLLIVTCYTASLHHTLFFRPQSVHSWRQCDGASYALNYYQFKNPFFLTATHTQTGKNGRTASEFPLFYYAAGKLYSIFGFHEYFIRVIHLLVVFAGLFALYRVIFYFIDNFIIALLPVMFLFCSPYVFYYSPNFLPNVPALGLMMIALLFFIKYIHTEKLLWLYLFAFFSLIGIIVKVSEGIIFISLIVLLFLRFFKIKSGIELNRKHLIHFAIVTLLTVIFSIAWYRYVIYYNKINGTGQNLTGILPIWNMTGSDIKLTFIKIFHPEWGWRGALHNDLILFLLSIIQLIFIFKWKQMNVFLRSFSLVLLVGTLCYSILWFQTFFHHDYYMLTLVIYPVFVFLTVTEYLYRSFGNHKAGKILFYAFSILLISVGIMHNRFIQHQRYFDPKYNDRSIHVYFDIEPYLRRIGIKNTDLVFSMPDKSPNITLYLMNQPGWTECFNDVNYDINYFAWQGVKYLIIGDSAYLKNPLYTWFIGERIGQYKNVGIYKNNAYWNYPQYHK